LRARPSRLIILISSIVAVFLAVILAAVFLQPRWERKAATASVDDAWSNSGFESLRAQGFSLYQIVSSDRRTQAEFIFQDESGRELGRYISTGTKSATIEHDGKPMHLYIQGSGINRTIYSGKVGGSADNSIVIRDDDHLIAEIWRNNALPPVEYKLVYAGETFTIRSSGWSPTRAGTIDHGGQQAGAFRRPSIWAQNILIAVDGKISDELKRLFCSAVLLR
jgi:hypothetical protein